MQIMKKTHTSIIPEEYEPYSTGKWSVMGFLMTFNNFNAESDAFTENLCKSCTINPANLGKVRGILV